MAAPPDPGRGIGASAAATVRAFPAPLVDGLLFGVVLAASLLLFFAVAGEAAARDPDLLGAGLLVASALPLLARRRWPLVAFGALLAVVLVYFSFDYPGGAELPIILAGIYSLAVSGHRRWTVALVVGFFLVGTAYRIVAEGEPALTATISGALLLLVALVGDGVHTRRQLRAATRQQMLVAEAEKESEARARVAEERLRIAHELHDVMAHTITTMTVQAGAAADQLDRDPEGVRTALAAMRGSARDAMAELRAVISVLRTRGAPTDRMPTPGLARLDEVVATAEQAGVTVHLVTDGLEQALPPAIDLTCFRIVQEALTNVIRHSGAGCAEVRVQVRASEVLVEVTDDGRGPDTRGAAASAGFGLVGLRERAAAVGGQLEAGAGSARGFRVAATLPLAEGVRDDG